MLEMLRCVGNGQIGEFGKPFHRPFALRDVFQQHKTMRMTKRARNLGQVGEEQCVCVGFCH